MKDGGLSLGGQIRGGTDQGGWGGVGSDTRWPGSRPGLSWASWRVPEGKGGEGL
jgi:hypothetical protein